MARRADFSTDEKSVASAFKSKPLLRGLFLGMAVLLVCCLENAPWSLCLVAAEERRIAGKPSGPVSQVAAASLKLATGSLKLAAWNLQWLSAREGLGKVPRRAEDYRLLQAMAGRLQADIVAVQEVQGVGALAKVFQPTVYQLLTSAREGPLRTGFAIRKPLRVTQHPDYAALDVGGLRRGTDITVHWRGGDLRLLSVHLKSGCFEAPLSSGRRGCPKLRAQLPVLEAWVDARAREGVDFAVLGDFNRRLFARSKDEFWEDLNDGHPLGVELWSPTAAEKSRCWNARYPQFIDHLVFGSRAQRHIVKDSFQELLYRGQLSGQRVRLSDHCPISIQMRAMP